MCFSPCMLTKKMNWQTPSLTHMPVSLELWPVVVGDTICPIVRGAASLASKILMRPKGAASLTFHSYMLSSSQPCRHYGCCPVAPVVYPCLRHGLGYFFGLSFSLCLTLHFFLSPLWPCSAALAICAQANREQRDGRRAVPVGVQEGGRGNVKGKGKVSGGWKKTLWEVFY